jgi:hypothetical protein
MDKIAEWMTSPAGRWARIGAGASLLLVGLARRNYFVAALGALPLLGGAFDLLLISPLLGLPATGRNIRREIGVLQGTSLFPPDQRPPGLAAIA